MTKIVRWNRVEPINIFDQLDRVFNQSTVRWNNEWSVALDVLEGDDGYVVKASLPGVNADDVELTFEDNVLTIKGEVKQDETVDEARYHVRERRFGSFSRSIRFPVWVNGDAIEAGYENGVLSLNVPKAEEVKPKRIEIKSS